MNFLSQEGLGFDFPLYNSYVYFLNLQNNLFSRKVKIKLSGSPHNHLGYQN
jgi:hypothetical protein